MTSGRHPSEKSVGKCKQYSFLREKCYFWVVKLVVNEYAVQTYGLTTWSSEAYFCWLRFDKVWLKLAVGKNRHKNRSKKSENFGKIPEI